MKYRGLQLDVFQTQAIAHLEAGRSVLVAAPTGTGKTIIADWIVDQAVQTGRRVIYTAPIKALSNQKFRDYTRLHGEETVGLVTGDLVIRRDAPCLVMTTEILRNMLLTGDDLSNLMAVIIDEIHFLDDRERGTVWEEVLIYLPPSVQIVGLSATLSNLTQFADWLGSVRGEPVEVIIEETRAVPLSFRYGSVDTGLCSREDYEKRWHRLRHRAGPPARNGGRRGRGGRQGGRRGRPKRRTTHVDLFEMMLDDDLLPYLYFVFSRRDTEICARGLLRTLSRSLLDEDDQARLDAHLNAAAAELGPALDPDLRELYRHGVAFHHAGLHVQLKALVESLYEQRLIKVLYCTSTFALGINMPARSVVFDSLHKFDGRSMAPLTTRQFMQKAGRAGRRGMDAEGHVILRMDIEEYEAAKPQLSRYQRGAYEPVLSSFSLSWNSVVSLLASHPPERIRDIVEKSFLNWHLTAQAERHAAKAEQLSEGDSRGAHKEARRLRKRVAKAEGMVWSGFMEKVNYLQDIGYLDEEMGFNAGASFLRHLQIAELFMAELLLAGTLEDLDGPMLFGVLCAMTNELGRRVRCNFRISPEVRRVGRTVQQFRYGPVVEGGEQVTGMDTVWDPDLIEIGKAWVQGRSLQEILLMVQSETDISGDLIVGFRRAKDLASQLVEVYAELPERVEFLKELIRKVRRDEVEVVG